MDWGRLARVRLPLACIFGCRWSVPSPDFDIRYPHTYPIPHSHQVPTPATQPEGSFVMDCKYYILCILLCRSSACKRTLFSRVAGLAQVHQSHHESMSMHPGTRPRHLVQTHTTLRSLQRVLCSPFYTSRPPTEAHRSAAHLPSLGHQRSTQLIRAPLKKSSPRSLATFWSI